MNADPTYAVPSYGATERLRVATEYLRQAAAERVELNQAAKRLEFYKRHRPKFNRAVTRAYWNLKPLKHSFVSSVLPYVIVWALALAAAVLSGCATTNASYATADKTVTWSSRTLWKDIESVEVEWGDLKTSLGSSKGNGNEVLIACMIAPQLCPK